MAYKQNNPFSRKKSSPLNNGDEFDVHRYKFDIHPGYSKQDAIDMDTDTSVSGRPGATSYTDAGGTHYTEDVFRSSEFPAYEDLEINMDDERARDIYDRGREMTRDSLTEVARGGGHQARQVMGYDLGAALSKATSIGEYEGILQNLQRGKDDEANRVAAEELANTRISPHINERGDTEFNYLDPSKKLLNAEQLEKIRSRYDFSGSGEERRGRGGRVNL